MKTERLSGPSMLALAGDMSGPTLWRVLFPFTALHKLGYRADWALKDAPGIGSLAPLYDGFVIPRMAWKPGQRQIAEQWFSMIRRAGRFVVYDLDDDILTADLNYRAVELGWADGKTFVELEAERFERIWALQQADGVTVSTQRLATVVRSFTTRPVIVVPNAIDVPWFRRVLRSAERRSASPTIGWAGGRRPDRDLGSMAEAWARIARCYPAVTFVVQGHVPAVVTDAVPADRLLVLPWMPLERYPAGLVEVDIGCASVSDERFNRCKTAIKAYEYAVAGAAVVATPTLYSSVIKHGHSGLLVETADEWESALTRLIESHALRQIMATRLLRTVERKHALSANLWRWPQAWKAIADDAATRRVRLITGTIAVRNASA